MYRFNRKTSFAQFCAAKNISIEVSQENTSIEVAQNNTSIEAAKENANSEKKRKMNPMEELRLFQQNRWKKAKLKEKEEQQQKEEQARQEALAKAEEEARQALAKAEEVRQQEIARQAAKDAIVTQLHALSTSVKGDRPLWTMDGEVQDGDNLANSFTTIGEFADTLSRQSSQDIRGVIARISEEVKAWKENGGAVPTLIL